jgi:predicted nucleic acid-binding protein
LEDKLNAYDVIAGTILVARHYARLQATFGTSQQRNDLWVAACSLAQPEPFPVVTNNGDFDRIADRFPELVVVRPD